jgi:hypothetical protein
VVRQWIVTPPFAGSNPVVHPFLSFYCFFNSKRPRSTFLSLPSTRSPQEVALSFVALLSFPFVATPLAPLDGLSSRGLRGARWLLSPSMASLREGSLQSHRAPFGEERKEPPLCKAIEGLERSSWGSMALQRALSKRGHRGGASLPNYAGDSLQREGEQGTTKEQRVNLFER